MCPCAFIIQCFCNKQCIDYNYCTMKGNSVKHDCGMFRMESDQEKLNLQRTELIAICTLLQISYFLTEHIFRKTRQGRFYFELTPFQKSKVGHSRHLVNVQFWCIKFEISKIMPYPHYYMLPFSVETRCPSPVTPSQCNFPRIPFIMTEKNIK